MTDRQTTKCSTNKATTYIMATSAGAYNGSNLHRSEMLVNKKFQKKL